MQHPRRWPQPGAGRAVSDKVLVVAVISLTLLGNGYAAHFSTGRKRSRRSSHPLEPDVVPLAAGEEASNVTLAIAFEDAANARLTGREQYVAHFDG
jgi:hypothetical protein